MIATADSASAGMLRDLIGLPGVGVRAGDVGGGCDNSVVQVGTHFFRGVDVGCGMLSIDAHQDGGESVEEGVGVGLLHARRAARRNCSCDFLRRRRHGRARKRDK